jgi:hypothetical protein
LLGQEIPIQESTIEARKYDEYINGEFPRCCVRIFATTLNHRVQKSRSFHVLSGVDMLLLFDASAPSNIPQTTRKHELAARCSIDASRELHIFTNAGFSSYFQLVLRARFLQNAYRLTGGFNFRAKFAEYSRFLLREVELRAILCLGSAVS